MKNEKKDHKVSLLRLEMVQTLNRFIVFKLDWIDFDEHFINQMNGKQCLTIKVHCFISSSSSFSSSSNFYIDSVWLNHWHATIVLFFIQQLNFEINNFNEFVFIYVSFVSFFRHIKLLSRFYWISTQKWFLLYPNVITIQKTVYFKRLLYWI